MTRKLSGPEWFEKYRKSDARSAALSRLNVATGLNLKTLYRALVKAQPVSADVANKLVAFAGKTLDARALTLPDEGAALPMQKRKRRRTNSELDRGAAA